MKSETENEIQETKDIFFFTRPQHKVHETRFPENHRNPIKSIYNKQISCYMFHFIFCNRFREEHRKQTRFRTLIKKEKNILIQS